MDKKYTKMKYSRLSNTQQYILDKALKKVSLNTAEYIFKCRGIEHFDSSNKNLIYAGYYNAISKRIRANGSSIQHVHYVKDISTGQTILFSINDYKQNYNNMFGDRTLNVVDALKSIETNYSNHLISILNNMSPFAEEYDNIKYMKKLLILKRNNQLDGLRNLESMVNLLYYDLALSNSLKDELNNFETTMRLRKDFNDLLERNSEYNCALTFLLLSPLDESISNVFNSLYKKYVSIMEQYNKKKYLSEKQLSFLTKIYSTDFNKVEKMFKYLLQDDIKNNNIVNLYNVAVQYGLNEIGMNKLENMFKSKGGTLNEQ